MMAAVFPLPETARLEGLAAAVDPARAQALLERLLAPPGAAILGCEPVYIRSKGEDGAVVAWRVALAGAVSGTTFVTARAASSARLEAEAGRFAGRAGEPAFLGLRPLALAAEEGLLLLALPLDRALEALPALLDVRRFRRLLREETGWLGPGRRVSKSKSRVEPVRFKPERRAVVRWRLAIDGEEGATALYARLHAGPPGRPRRAARAAAAARAAGVRVAATVAALDHVGIEAELAGAPLDLERATDLEETGALLARLHGAPPGDDPGPPPPEDDAAAIEGLGLLGAELAAAARRLAGALARQGETGAPPVLLHGDFHRGQVLVDPAHGPGLLDFDRAASGPAARDLATFSAHLAATAPAATAARAVAALERGYARVRPLPPARERRREEAAALLRVAVLPFRTLDPRWPEAAARLVDAAARAAAGAEATP